MYIVILHTYIVITYKNQGVGHSSQAQICTKLPGDGSKLEVPESIFVGWKQPKRTTAGSALPLMAEDLLDLFEGFCAH